jgi:hypothetical protein
MRIMEQEMVKLKVNCENPSGRYQSKTYCWKNKDGRERQLRIISFNSSCIVFHHVLKKHCPAVARRREFISWWWRAIISKAESGTKGYSGSGQ